MQYALRITTTIPKWIQFDAVNQPVNGSNGNHVGNLKYAVTCQVSPGLDCTMRKVIQDGLQAGALVPELALIWGSSSALITASCGVGGC